MDETTLKLVPKCPFNNMQALVQVIAWHPPGDKPWTEPMMDAYMITDAYMSHTASVR